MMIETEQRPQTQREAQRQRRRLRPTRSTVPVKVSPHVRLVFEEMSRQRRTYDEVEEMSGVLRTTLKAWRHKNRPGIANLEAVFGVLGWDFVPIRREKVLPSALVDDLQAVAKKHDLQTSTTIEALFALVAGVHGRFLAPEIGTTVPSTAPTLAELSG